MQSSRKMLIALSVMVVALVVATPPSAAHAQQLYQWSNWMGTNAASIDYRYEITGQYIVMVQFRNRGNSAVTILYSVWIPGQNQAQTGTTYANANETSGGVNISTTNGQPPSRVEVQTR